MEVFPSLLWIEKMFGSLRSKDTKEMEKSWYKNSPFPPLGSALAPAMNHSLPSITGGEWDLLGGHNYSDTPSHLLFKPGIW